MSVRRELGAALPTRQGCRSSRLDAVLRAGQAHGVATGTRVAPEVWDPNQDRNSRLFGPRAKIAVENAGLNRAALARARDANQRTRRARAAAAAAQTAYVPLQAEANASDQPLSADEARAIREMGAKIVDLQREADDASEAMRRELREAKRLGDEARAELAQVRNEMAQRAAANGEDHAAANGEDLTALRGQIDTALKQLDDARAEQTQLMRAAARQNEELAEGQARLQAAEGLLAERNRELDAARQSGAANQEEIAQLRVSYERELSNLRNTLLDEQRQREDAARIAELEAYAPARMNEARNQLQNLGALQNAINQLEDNLEGCESEFDALKEERDALVRAQMLRPVALPSRRAPVAAPPSPVGLNDATFRAAVKVAVAAGGPEYAHPVYGPIAGWDVSAVTDMRRMFDHAIAFNGDLSRWDVRNVTNMGYMFWEAWAFNGDLSGWKVGNVTNMGGMFQRATAFNGDLSRWDVRNVTDMHGMFNYATAFNGDLSGWDVHNVTTMRGMFNHAAAFSGDLSRWDVGNVTDMNSMFYVASAFNGDLSRWDVRNVTNMNHMFFGASAFNGELSRWDVRNVTNMNHMFFGASAFNGDLSRWDVRKVTDMASMFKGAAAYRPAHALGSRRP